MRWPSWRGKKKKQRHCEETAEAARNRKPSPLEIWISKELFQTLPIGLDLAIYNTVNSGEIYTDDEIDQLNEQYPVQKIPNFMVTRKVEVERNGKTEKQKRKYYNFDKALKYVLDLTSWERVVKDRYDRIVTDAKGNPKKERAYHSNEIGSVMVMLMYAAQHHRKWVGVTDIYFSHILDQSRNVTTDDIYEAVRKKLFSKDLRDTILYFEPTEKLAQIVTKS